MNALRVNFVVHDFAAAIRFYSAMFARPPAILNSNSAEWMLPEPWMNFTIFASGAPRGETTPEHGWVPPREQREPQALFHTSLGGRSIGSRICFPVARRSKLSRDCAPDAGA